MTLLLRRNKMFWKKAILLIKDREQLTSEKSIKLNEIKIELNSNEKNIRSTQKNHAENIFLIFNHVVFFIRFKKKTRFDLFSKKQYVAQQAWDAYIASTYQFETSFNLFHVAQSIDFESKNVATLNKQLK